MSRKAGPRDQLAPAIEPLEPPHLSDAGNAQRFARDHRGSIHYAPALKTWFVWDTRRWARDELGEVMRRAKATVNGIYAEAAYTESEEQRRALGKHALHSEHEHRIRAMIALAESEPGIPILPNQLDADPWLLNVMNGTQDLRVGKLRPHHPEDLITKLAPVSYDPAATCPGFMQFLDRIFAGRSELIDFMQRAIGYTLTRATSERCFFLLWGSGANGKTTFLRVLHTLFGDYAAATRPDTFMVKQNGAIPNDVAALKGARFVVAAEAERGQLLAEALVKQLTGEDPLTARFMRAEWFSFTSTFKVFIATNYKPTIRGTDDAIWSRIRLVPFTVTIPEAEQDKRLVEKLLAEGPGILRWALEGCLAWQRDGLGVSTEVRTATESYREEMDVLGQFLAERCIIDPHAVTASSALYEAYLSWGHANHQKLMSHTAFGRALEDRGFPKDRTIAKRSRCGLRLRTPTDSGSANDGL